MATEHGAPWHAGAEPAKAAQLAGERLADFIVRHAGLLVITGAGCSTASGIPAYRDRQGRWANPAPIQFGEFRRSRCARQRYWARSFVGWPRFAGAVPGPAHQALAALEQSGWVVRVVTQNVDRLHSRAGSAQVVDLHGRLDRVVCLDCRREGERAQVQRALARLNPSWAGAARPAGRLRPDGDAELHGEHIADFRFPACEHCAGVLKPDVVFFGENVPAERVEAVRTTLAAAPALLVVGSSLMVLSGYRFVREALAAGKPVAVLNQGTTRADRDPILKLDAECGACLGAVTQRLGGARSAQPRS